MMSSPETAAVRCCACHRLLFVAEPDAVAAAIRIKCPRCKAVNILRPHRAPAIERDQRPTDHRGKAPGE
ncbi:Com family DNA-binding transcriptional regulator [Pseudogemmobacter blasticus]|uniref:Com family DNA-binding transcriptional regulator n=1 Tax=Fuscovulum blasticum DSM 2131 TaxID=1188250 RepID=A0A2T4JDE0_FUSBL|nr:Com family DNA-binding transcriptional regulator [Fuscovulum blasticum DSM 2131]